MGNVVVPLVMLSGAGVLVYVGITDPEGGGFAGLGRLMRGEPSVSRTATSAAFLPSLGQLAANAMATPTTRPGGVAPIVGVGAAPASSSAARARVVAEAKTWLGVPYQWGGNDRNGVDCSGLTVAVYKTVGVSLPRVSAAQALVGTPRTLAQAQPGDLVFFADPIVYHVGIYLGGGVIRHAPRTGTVVRDEKIWGGSIVTVRDVLSGIKPAKKKRKGVVST